MSETMTAEQAASKLTNIMHDDHYSWHPSVLEAFRMAVDALRGADGDCISRADVNRVLEDWFRTVFGADSFRKTGLCRELRELPSAQPQRWIPCGKCIHADGKHRWCKVLDRTINEDDFCCWAEPFREEGEADGQR